MYTRRDELADKLDAIETEFEKKVDSVTDKIKDRKGTTVVLAGGLAAIGGVAGGPLGAAAGGMVGGYIGEKLYKRKKKE